ncbi:MAG: class I SAM-dependent methyltransferase [Verrucomicrobiota bacterium]
MSFDRVARSYRLLETLAFGQALQRARIQWLDNIPRPKRVLILGEGNGRFLCELLRVHPKIDIDCVDASTRMLSLAETRLRRSHPESCQHVRFIHADILQWSPPNSYDLIVTHFFLDCFPRNELKAIVDKLAHAAAPGAVWLLADFDIPPVGIFAQMQATFLLRLMYLFFRYVAGITANALVDPSPHLEATNFILMSRRTFRVAMIKSELWQQ